MNNVPNCIWFEKYRPKKLDDLILIDDYKKIIKSWVDSKEIPHLLFLGPPGSGKTSLANIIINNIIINPLNVLSFNGSSKRGIDIVREQIEEFLSSQVQIPDNIKIVFIDEFDYMTGDAQAALRNIMETYYKSGRFLLTANFETKINDAILSRTQTLRFRNLPKNEILKKCEFILNCENVSYNIQDLKIIITSLYPDIRKIFSALETGIIDNKLKVRVEELKDDINILVSNIKKLQTGIIKNNKQLINTVLEESIKLIKKKSIDFIFLYETLLNDEELYVQTRIIISKYYNDHFVRPSAIVNYMAMLNEIVSSNLWLSR